VLNFFHFLTRYKLGTNGLTAIDSANFENYVKGPTFHNAMDELFGHGIFNADGEQWKYQRKTAANIFNVKNFRDHFTAYVIFLGMTSHFSNICL
jgi:cytochrome P450